MKVYRRRPGVELLEICGESLLVATREARGLCPFVTQLNASASQLWKLFDATYSVNDFAEYAAQALGKEAKSMLLTVIFFVSKMSESGHLIEEEIE